MLDQAQMQAMVKPNATVVIGYCFGAAAVLDLAASWPDAATDNVLGEAHEVIALVATVALSKHHEHTNVADSYLHATCTIVLDACVS